MVKGKSKKELPEEILNEDGIVDATLSLDDFEPDFDDLAVEDEEDITEEDLLNGAYNDDITDDSVRMYLRVRFHSFHSKKRPSLLKKQCKAINVQKIKWLKQTCVWLFQLRKDILAVVWNYLT